MSCNGCRVLRKGCSENCILRPCLQWIESPESQGHATVFVAKFFGRAGLMSFISNVPENQRPALFQSLLFEAAGRTVNPVNGAVGLLWTGNWNVCQTAVETVLRGGALRPIQEFLGGGGGGASEMDDASDCTQMFQLKDSSLNSRSKVQKRRRMHDEPMKMTNLADLNLSLMPGLGNNYNDNNSNTRVSKALLDEKRRIRSPSENSEESGTTTCLESNFGDQNGDQSKLLNLFN